VAGHFPHLPTPTFTSVNCPASYPIQCFASSPYRTITGICNNINNNVLWGSSSTALLRFVPSSYADRRFIPRRVSNYAISQLIE